MARRYRTTRARHAAVLRVLAALHLAALSATGLSLLDERQTQACVARHLPGRGHAARNRLLRAMPRSTRAVTGVRLGWVRRHGGAGSLCPDDVIVEQAFAKRLRRAGRACAPAEKRQGCGLHSVGLGWCDHGGRWRLPVAVRRWRPKRSCAKRDYRTKPELAATRRKEAVGAGVRADGLAFDTRDTAGWFTTLASRLGLAWHGTRWPKTTIAYRGRRGPVREIAPPALLRWRAHLGLRAGAATVYAPTYGPLRLVVTGNRHGNDEYPVSNAPGADLTTMVRHKRARWSVETVVRDTKQCAALGACQARADRALVRHGALVFLACGVLQHVRADPRETAGGVKDRWQSAVLRDREPPPAPVRACPPDLRATA